MTLQQQLEYFWERGFYSVVKDKWDDYYVVSTKSFSGAFFVTEPHIAIDAAKHQVGNSKEYQDYLLDQMADAKNGGWKILENETFHPSELMGKGFQVGDKVTIPTSKEPEDVYEITDTYGRGEYSISCIKHEDHCHDVYHQVLKPVLPVEESKTDLEKLLGCNVIVDGRITGGAVVMVDAKGKAIAMFKEGKIVNF